MAPLVASLALDNGNGTGLLTDQRGRQRTYDNPATTNAPGGDGTDIGAFELQLPTPVFIGLQKSGNNVVLNVLTEVGWNYRVEQTDSLTSVNWNTVADNLPGTGASLQVTDATSANQSRRFYRARTIP